MVAVTVVIPRRSVLRLSAASVSLSKTFGIPDLARLQSPDGDSRTARVPKCLATVDFREVA
jgi:hypothetical protein